MNMNKKQIMLWVLLLSTPVVQGMMRRSLQQLVGYMPKGRPTPKTLAVFAEQGKKYTNELVLQMLDKETQKLVVRPLEVSDCSEKSRQNFDEWYQADDALRARSELFNRGDLANAPIEVCYVSRRVGYGVFATEDLKADTFVAVYVGDVTNMPSLVGLSVKRDNTYSLGYMLDLANQNLLSGTTVIDADEYRNETAYMNHAGHKHTNMELRLVRRSDGLVIPCLYTTKDVKVGTELRWHYGGSYFMTDPGMIMRMLCVAGVFMLVVNRTS